VAMAELNKYTKVYDRQPKVTNFLDTVLKESDVTISLTSVAVGDKVITPLGGGLGEFTAFQPLAREMANILTVYTSQDKESVTQIVTSASSRDIRIPSLDLVTIRKMVEVPGPSNIETRDAIYAKLLKKGKEGEPDEWKSRVALLYISNYIYSTPDLFPMSAVDPKISAWYSKYCVSEVMKSPQVRFPKVTTFNAVMIGDPIRAWRFYNKSIAIRGGRRGKGAISAGYYRFDLPAAEVDVIDEVTDIINIASTYGYAAVTMIEPKMNVIKLLVHNGITVYCVSITSTVQGPKDPVGVYGRGTRKRMIWMAATQTSPVLDGKSIKFPDPVIMPTEISFVYEYIPAVLDGRYNYIPSIKASEGLVIKTNMTSLKNIKKGAITVVKLLERFSLAVYYRNWFIFSRVTFVSRDIYRTYFSYKWVYPKQGKDSFEDLFAGATEAFSPSLDTNMYSQAGATCAVEEESESEYLSKFLAALEDESVHSLYIFYDSLKGIPDQNHRLYQYYNNLHSRQFNPPILERIQGYEPPKPRILDAPPQPREPQKVERPADDEDIDDIFKDARDQPPVNVTKDNQNRNLI